MVIVISDHLRIGEAFTAHPEAIVILRKPKNAGTVMAQDKQFAIDLGAFLDKKVVGSSIGSWYLMVLLMPVEDIIQKLKNGGFMQPDEEPIEW